MLIGVALVSTVEAQTAREVARKALPSVVLILAPQVNGRTASLGSGFFVRAGVVGTNYHVIKGSTKLYIKLIGQGGSYGVGRVVATDVKRDLALLYVDGIEAPALRLAAIPEVEVGDEVFAIGNPEGLEGTLSQGIVSGLREVEGQRYIQITAAISHGSSGGPILNSSGEVIGIAVGALRVGQNLNFAIPAKELATLLGRRPTDVSESPHRESLRDLDTSNLPNRKPFGFGPDEIRIEQRIRSHEREARLHPDSPEAHFKLAEVYRNWGYDEHAVREYRKAIRMRPETAEAYYGLGKCYQSMYSTKILDESKRLGALAAEAFKNAIRLKPDYAEAHLGLGDAYSDLSRYDEAVEEIELAIRIRPRYRDACVELGFAYKSLASEQEFYWITDRASREESSRLAVASLKKAMESLKKAIAIAANFSDSYYWLGECYEKEKRFDDAIATYSWGIMSVSSSPAPVLFDEETHVAYFFDEPSTLITNLYYVYYKTGRLDEGIDRFRTLARTYPQNQLVHLELGRLYLATKQKDLALGEYKTLKAAGSGLAETLFAEIYK
jgi:tetratricopeptide (TPR) repeat protein